MDSGVKDSVGFALACWCWSKQTDKQTLEYCMCAYIQHSACTVHHLHVCLHHSLWGRTKPLCLPVQFASWFHYKPQRVEISDMCSDVIACTVHYWCICRPFSCRWLLATDFQGLQREPLISYTLTFTEKLPSACIITVLQISKREEENSVWSDLRDGTWTVEFSGETAFTSQNIQSCRGALMASWLLLSLRPRLSQTLK